MTEFLYQRSLMTGAEPAAPFLVPFDSGGRAGARRFTRSPWWSSPTAGRGGGGAPARTASSGVTVVEPGRFRSPRFGTGLPPRGLSPSRGGSSVLHLGHFITSSTSKPNAVADRGRAHPPRCRFPRGPPPHAGRRCDASHVRDDGSSLPARRPRGAAHSSHLDSSRSRWSSGQHHPSSEEGTPDPAKDDPGPG